MFKKFSLHPHNKPNQPTPKTRGKAGVMHKAPPTDATVEETLIDGS